MDRREAKRRALNARRMSWPHVSSQALSAILQSCRDDGIPDGNLHRNELRAAKDQLNSDDTPYGPIASTIEVYNKNDEPMEIPIANPFGLLWKAVRECKPFADFLYKRLQEKPCSRENPWGLILYTDGVTPGDVLSPVNRRKFQTCYFSFIELGCNALAKEESWFTLLIEFETVIGKVSAGLSQVFGSLVKAFFQPDGFDMAVAGVLLPFEAGDTRLFCRFKTVIQDGLAHKQVWHSRGDAATRPCLLCANLVTESSGLVGEDRTGLLKANAITWADLHPAIGATIRGNARNIARQSTTLSAERFAELQQSLGFTHHPRGILLDRSLDVLFDPTEVFQHDWMHGIFVDGCFNAALYMLFESFIQAGKANVYAVCEDYVSKWEFPKWTGAAHLEDIFSEGRKVKHRKAHHIKSQASDLLCLVPVLALFAQTVLLKMDGACVTECLAFLALIDVIELIRSTPRVAVPPDMMLKAVEECLRLWSTTFGFDSMTPKWHWMLHFHRTLSKFDGVMLNCFCLERKHRMPKRYASELKNISGNAGRSILSNVTAHHFGALGNASSFSFEVGLVDGRAASRRMKREVAHALGLEGAHDIKAALVSRFNPLATCAKNDIVLVKSEARFRAGRVQFHCEVDGEALSLVSLFTLRKHDAACGYAVWEVSDGGAIPVPTASILDVVVYSKWADNLVCTLLPCEYR